MSFSLYCIINEANSASFNMATDLYLMRQCVITQSIYLRLYRWKPSAISIGSLQHASRQLNLEKCTADNIEWIRRPTGGRAVLHRDDITYSCFFPQQYKGAGMTVETTYALIMRCLVAGLNNLNIFPEIQNSSDPKIKSGRHVKLPCFLAPNRNEIMIHGRKLIGSAQYRGKDAIMQHGSIPITPANTLLPNYLQLDPQEQQAQCALLRQKSISLSDISSLCTISDIISALRYGFSTVLQIEANTVVLSKHDHDEIKLLQHSPDFIRKWCQDISSQ